MQRRHWKRKYADSQRELFKYADKYCIASDRIVLWRDCCMNGKDCIQIRQDGEANSILVIGATSPDYYFIIKSFPYTPESICDYEFAMQEAEELVDKLQEK